MSSYLQQIFLERRSTPTHGVLEASGAAELLESITESMEKRLNDIVAVVGVFGMTNADEVFGRPELIQASTS